MNGKEMGAMLRKAADEARRYAVYGAYRVNTGRILISQISRSPKGWDEAREELAVFTKNLPNNTTYFIGEYTWL